MLTDTIGEIADRGLLVTGGFNRFSSSRSDLCYGHGIEITGSHYMFASCLSLNNGKGRRTRIPGEACRAPATAGGVQVQAQQRHQHEVWV